MVQSARDLSSEPGRGDESPPGATIIQVRSPRQLFWIRFKQDRLAIAGAVAIAVMLFLAATAGFWAHFTGHPYNLIDIRHRTDSFGIPLGPDRHYWFGSGIALAVAYSPSEKLVIFLISFFGWPYIARIVRGQTLSLREAQFVEAAQSLGAPARWIMFREILPNLVAPILIYSTLVIPANILGEAGLSFLGVGIQEPTPAWGSMLSNATQYVALGSAWWYMAFPGLALFVTVLGFNLLGDGLRDALDPRTGR